MKRKVLAGTGIAAAAIGALMTMNVFAAQITQEQAKAIAMENAGVAAEDVTFIRAELDYEDGRQVYDVEFLTKDYREYDYEIDTANGAVIKMDYDAETTFYFEGGNAQSGAGITSDEAKKLALDHAGLKEEDIPFVKVRLDFDDGRQMYDVEFYTNDYKEYDYEIDASTGKIIGWDYDAEDFYRDAQSQAAWTAELTVEEAKAKALQIAGLGADQVTWGSIHHDYDDGRQVYEGKFFFGNMEYEFELDANTGNVMDWDMESIYH